MTFLTSGVIGYILAPSLRPEQALPSLPLLTEDPKEGTRISQQDDFLPSPAGPALPKVTRATNSRGLGEEVLGPNRTPSLPLVGL